MKPSKQQEIWRYSRMFTEYDYAVDGEEIGAVEEGVEEGVEEETNEDDEESLDDESSDN